MHPQIKLNGQYWRRVAADQCMKAPNGHVVQFKPPTRSTAQNARLHAMLAAIEKTGFEWGGRKRDLPELKCLFVSGWMRATHQDEETIPGFDGEPVQLRKSTAEMTVEQLGELMEYIGMWCADHEPPIDLNEPANHA